jgi:hypothetical protein
MSLYKDFTSLFQEHDVNKLIAFASLLLIVHISLSAGLLPGSFASGNNEGFVEWVDQTSGRVLFTLADIVRFDWDRQVFELKHERAMDLMAYMAPPSSTGQKGN